MEKWIKTQNGTLVKPYNIIYDYNYGQMEVITRLGNQSYITLGIYDERDGNLIKEQIEEFIINGIVNIFIMPPQ